jgi:CheY-like chemotaxis protein
MRPVLVVEDEVQTREALVELLRSAGFSVLASDEGRKALELAAAMSPSAIILDLAMEGMSGWEFLARRRGTPLARTPVVVITGSAEAEVAEVEDAVVLRKPLDVDRLLTTLRRISRPDRS